MPVRSHPSLQTVQKTIPNQSGFALIINMFQRKRFKRLEIFLPSPIFYHGQLYVTFSLAS